MTWQDVYLFPPNATANLYMDHHPKYGLSPINVDRVDLERFPALASVSPLHARMQSGDALFIPDGWWHVIHSHGRNVAVALELSPYRSSYGLWPPEVARVSHLPGLYWAEQVRISSRMREELWEQIPSSSHGGPITCETPLEAPPASLGQCPWLGQDYRHP